MPIATFCKSIMLKAKIMIKNKGIVRLCNKSETPKKTKYCLIKSNLFKSSICNIIKVAAITEGTAIKIIKNSYLSIVCMMLNNAVSAFSKIIGYSICLFGHSKYSKKTVPVAPIVAGLFFIYLIHKSTQQTN